MKGKSQNHILDHGRPIRVKKEKESIRLLDRKGKRTGRGIRGEATSWSEGGLFEIRT